MATGLFAVGSAAALGVPVFWFGLVLLLVFSPLSGSLPVGFFPAANTYAPVTDDPLPWLVLATLAAICHRSTRSALRDALGEVTSAPPGPWACASAIMVLACGLVRSDL